MLDNASFVELAHMYKPFVTANAGAYAIAGVPGLEFDDLVQEILIKLVDVVDKHGIKRMDRIFPTAARNRIVSLYRYAVNPVRDFRLSVSDSTELGLENILSVPDFALQKHAVDQFIDQTIKMLTEWQVLLLFELLYPRQHHERPFNVSALSRALDDRQRASVHRDLRQIRATAAYVAFDMGWENHINF